jgi:hypothetical protein
MTCFQLLRQPAAFLLKPDADMSKGKKHVARAEYCISIHQSITTHHKGIHVGDWLVRGIFKRTNGTHPHGKRTTCVQ